MAKSRQNRRLRKGPQQPSGLRGIPHSEEDSPPRPVQYFSKEYLERCRTMSPAQIVKFLDDFRRALSPLPGKSRLISIKVPETLLEAFKTRARLSGVPYQTQIKRLMADWLDPPAP
jgi:hypothetical protein